MVARGRAFVVRRRLEGFSFVSVVVECIPSILVVVAIVPRVVVTLHVVVLASKRAEINKYRQHVSET